MNRKMRRVLLLSLLCIACAKTFLVSKDHATYFFGSPDQTLYEMLCTSGDLQKILADAGLPEDARTGLYRAQCNDRSTEELDRVYSSLSQDQQEALKSSFRKHNFEINVKPSPNFRFYPY